MGHYGSNEHFLEDLACEHKNYAYLGQYEISKLFNVLFTVGLHNFFQKSSFHNLKAVVLHPGIVDTNIASDFCLTKYVKCCFCCFFTNSENGAQTNLHLSRIPFEEVKSGEYYHSDSTHREMDKRGRNMELVDKLWRISEEAYGIKFD